VIRGVFHNDVPVHLFGIDIFTAELAGLSFVVRPFVSVELPLGLAHLLTDVAGELGVAVKFQYVFLHVALQGGLAALGAQDLFAQLVSVGLVNVLPADGVVFKIIRAVLAARYKHTAVFFNDVLLVVGPRVKGEIRALRAAVVVKLAPALDVLRVLAALFEHLAAADAYLAVVFRLLLGVLVNVPDVILEDAKFI